MKSQNLRLAALVVALGCIVQRGHDTTTAAEPHLEDPVFYRTTLTLNDAPEMRGGDLITDVHECTHGINSRLRQRYGAGGGSNCFYVGSGRFVMFPEPRPLTIGAVASRVKYRGTTFNTYLVQSRGDWDREPLYLFDEWVAYVNGTLIAWEKNFPGHDSTLWFAMEHAHYCATLVEMLPASYTQRSELARFWCWNARRLDAVAYRSATTGRMWNPRLCPGWRAEMHRADARIRKMVIPRDGERPDAPQLQRTISQSEEQRQEHERRTKTRIYDNGGIRSVVSPDFRKRSGGVPYGFPSGSGNVPIQPTGFPSGGS